MTAAVEREAETTVSFSGREKLRIIGGILFCSFLGALDHSIVAPALPAISTELDAATALSWVVTAYLLASTIGIPLFGKLSDAIGRAPTVTIAVGGFVIGSVACALAPSLFLLIISRAIQGLFGGALQALGHIVIADVLTPKERGRYQGYITSMFVVAGFLGPVLGGFFSEYAGWRLIFWVNLPLGLAAIAINRRTLAALPAKRRRGAIDLIGLVLLSAGTVPLVLALSVGGVEMPWLSPQIVALLAAAALLWALFAWRIRTAGDPFIAPGVLADPVIARCFGSTVLIVGVAGAVSVYLPIYYQGVLGFSDSQAGLALVGMSMGTVLGSFISGNLMARMERYRLPTVAGLALAALSALLIAAPAGGLSAGMLLAATAVMGIGMGSYYPFSTVTVQNAAPPAMRGTTLGALNFVRAVGQAVVIALFGAIVLSAPLAGCADTACAAEGAAAFRILFVLAAAGIALSALIVFQMREVPLRETLDLRK